MLWDGLCGHCQSSLLSRVLTKVISEVPCFSCLVVWGSTELVQGWMTGHSSAFPLRMAPSIMMTWYTFLIYRVLSLVLAVAVRQPLARRLCWPIHLILVSSDSGFMSGIKVLLDFGRSINSPFIKNYSNMNFTSFYFCLITLLGNIKQCFCSCININRHKIQQWYPLTACGLHTT